MGALLFAIPPPPLEAFHIGHLRVTVHGILTLIPVLIAGTLTSYRWRRRGGSADLVWEAALWSVLGGIVGARLYHVVTSWSEVPDEWWGVFAIWKGGLASWGGLLGGTIAGVWFLRRRGIKIAPFLDAAAPAVVLAYGLGRLGNYSNQELFGPPTDLPWALEVERAFRPDRYEGFATFQPTFLYELLWDAAIAVALIWIGSRLRIRPGGLFVLFIAAYSFGRIFEELFFRIDPAHYYFGLRLNFFVATILAAAASAAFVVWQRRWPNERGEPQRRPARATA